MPVYGLAECSVGLAFPGLDRGPVVDVIEREPFVLDGRAIPAGDADTGTLRFMACGRPLPGHEVRILDAAGRELPDRQEGRLQFRGPSTCGGYFRNPEETSRLFDGDWLNSGDLAYIVEGDIYLTGRTKDIIIRAGRNIYPQELEEMVGDIPGIRKGSVVAFASNDPRSATERLVIVAETSETESRLFEELRSTINALTTDILGTPPDDIVLTGPKTILKTSSGKIRRAANRELYERGWFGKPQSAVWWQVMRIALEGMKPRVRRMLHRVVAGLYAAYIWLLFGAARTRALAADRGFAASGMVLDRGPGGRAVSAVGVGHLACRTGAGKPSGRSVVCAGRQPCQLHRQLCADGRPASPVGLRGQGRACQPLEHSAAFEQTPGAFR